MKALVLALALLLGSAPAPSLEQRAAHILRITGGRLQMGHACPIAPRLALSARHMVENQSEEKHPFEAYRYESIDSQMSGDLYPQSVWTNIDLGEFKTAPGHSFSSYYPIAKDCPALGDRVLHAGYNHAFKRPDYPNIVEAKVVNSYAGWLLYDDSALAGSSGSCLLNSKDEVVGINVGSSDRSEHPGDNRYIGLAVEICGPWMEQLTQEDKLDEPQQ